MASAFTLGEGDEHRGSSVLDRIYI